MCRELSISSNLLNQWQNQAMEAMVTALSPKRKDRPETLNPRLNRLIEKNLPDPTEKLHKRLRAIEAKAS
jgi:transposase-like protein